jgi:hypothetical protein
MRAEVMEAIEVQLYRHFGVPESIIDVITGQNQLQDRRGRFRARVKATRMSGEMNTSLGNSFTNIMLMLYCCHCHGVNVEGCVEGDDGVFGTDAELSGEWFAQLGFKLDLVRTMTVNTAGFCSMFWSTDGTLMCDPLRLVRLGWSLNVNSRAGQKFRTEMLGSTAMCLAYELGGCPIYWAWAKKFARLGRVADSYWTRYELESAGVEYVATPGFLVLKEGAVIKAPTYDTRVDYAVLYGISIAAQMDIESQIMKGVDIRNGELNSYLDEVYPDLVKNWDQFVW